MPAPQPNDPTTDRDSALRRRSRVRYYGCEALYNIAKVRHGSATPAGAGHRRRHARKLRAEAGAVAAGMCRGWEGET